MKKLLIIGDDVHAIRYVSTLIFNDNLEIFILEFSSESTRIANVYGIEKLSIKNIEIKVNDFDFIIYTMPNKFEMDMYLKLKKYKKILLLEKIQMNIELIEKLNCRKYFIHLRDFENTNYDLNQINYIRWPNLKIDGMDEVIHTVPNIIDLILNILKIKLEYKFIVKKAIKDDKSIKFNLFVGNYMFNVEVYNTTNKDYFPTINDKIIIWPNFFNCISNLIDDLLAGNLDYSSSIDKEKIYVELIKRIEGDIYGFRKYEI